MSTKNRVLELLEAHKEEHLSGEYIAGLLLLSRNSVWKAIRELRKDGYNISAVTNKGYCLGRENDILSAQGIMPFLTIPLMAGDIQVYDSLESTNTKAKALAIADAAHGTVILAERQTLGRGRYGRQFYSPAGGLYMSVVLHPEKMSFQLPTLVTAFAAVAVCEAIETVTRQKPGIKWVNDILINDLKVGGILTEAVTDFESGQLQWIVLGIGINANIGCADFPKELEKIAGSLDPDGTSPIARNRLAAEIINRVLDCSADEKAIIDAYHKRLTMLGQQITVCQGKEVFEATAVDVDHSGYLIVRKMEGNLITLSSGEIHVQSTSHL